MFNASKLINPSKADAKKKREDNSKTPASKRQRSEPVRFRGRMALKNKPPAPAPAMAAPPMASVPAMKNGGKFIQSAIKHPGALHEQLGVPKGEKIPAGKLAAAAKKKGKLGQRARFAETLKSFK